MAAYTALCSINSALNLLASPPTLARSAPISPVGGRRFVRIKAKRSSRCWSLTRQLSELHINDCKPNYREAGILVLTCCFDCGATLDHSHAACGRCGWSEAMALDMAPMEHEAFCKLLAENKRMTTTEAHRLIMEAR